MSHKQSVIELNGKHYDAVTGKQIHATASVTPKVVTTVKGKGKNLDGFVRVTQTKTIHPIAAKPKKPTAERTVQHAKRQPQTTKTLMRTLVKKPGKHPASISGVSAPATANMIAAPVVTQQKRIERVKHVAKSPLISRFGAPVTTSTITKKHAHVPVTPAPAHAPAITKPAAKKPTHHTSAAESHVAKALEKANSHTKPQLAKQKRRHKAAKRLGVSSRFISTAAATLSVLLLVGFFAYQYAPNINVRMAAARAGFDAKLPGYHPGGFAMSGPVQAGPGVVTINFASNSDDRSFQISQRPSEWNSDALLSNFIESKNQPYQVFQEAGKTVYLYDNSSATWVSGGVWYQIEGNSSLSSDQLLRIASSL